MRAAFTMPKRRIFIIVLAVFIVLAASFTANASPRQETIHGPVTGKVLDVLDGDTLSVRLHVWIGQQLETSVRIAGIDTPEIKGKCEKERGMAQAARRELESLVSSGDIVLTDIRLEKYAGRVLAKAHTSGGISIADHLIAKGLARPYEGKKRLGWCG